MATKTLSIRIDEDDYRFLAAMAEEEKEDVSKAVRELVELGRLHLAMDKYRSSEASLEKSARIAGVSVSRMMNLLRDFGIEANLELEDYRASLNTARSLF
jgi:predicted HTH domain antitoxin